jgi:hypothetical protein
MMKMINDLGTAMARDMHMAITSIMMREMIIKANYFRKK